jgi:hypothetical protein
MVTFEWKIVSVEPKNDGMVQGSGSGFTGMGV